MSIQRDLQFSKINGKIQLIVFTDLTPESQLMLQIQFRIEIRQQQLATHVLQLIRIGIMVFRFPFAHFPSGTTFELEF